MKCPKCKGTGITPKYTIESLIRKSKAYFKSECDLCLGKGEVTDKTAKDYEEYVAMVLDVLREERGE